jgi:hypothetical protein
MSAIFPCQSLTVFHQDASSIYGVSSNVNWLTQSSKITKAKHKDVIVTSSCRLDSVIIIIYGTTVFAISLGVPLFTVPS